MLIKYFHSDYAWDNYEVFLINLIKKYKSKSIVEIGGGANPALSIENIEKLNVSYTVLDISAEELSKSKKGYHKYVADISDPSLKISQKYDFIFTKMLAEHIRDGEVFHENVLKLLNDGGIAFHFFPTLYAPPFLVNWMLPEKLARRLLYILQPGREKSGKHAKFPAYYSFCKGPINSQMKFFNKLGYKVDAYYGFFGHGSYYQKLKPLFVMHECIARWLVKNPNPWVTSFAYVVLKKPVE